MVKQPLYQKTRDLPVGTVLVDQRKGQWSIGPVIGQGGFGCIYSAKIGSSEFYDKVIKIEPAKNGPLFTEINFYKRVAKEDDIKKFIKEKKLDFLGMPKYISFGLFEEDRFLVMDRFGEDLHKTLMRGRLSAVCVLQIAINMLDVLEYIHSMDYAHADIKALNIMRGYLLPSQVYLLDFGMVSKFSDNGQHREEKIDPKCKNNGTVEFCARDSHTGLQPSRRGDIESLLYNIIFWLTWDDKNPNSSRAIGFGRLPWLSILQDIKSEKILVPIINKVAESKTIHMKDPQKFIESVGLDIHTWSKYLVKMLSKVNQYKYTEQPDYDGTRKDIAAIIAEIEGKPLNVNNNRTVLWDIVAPSLSAKPRTSRKRSSYDMKEEQDDNAVIKKKRVTHKKKNVTNNSSVGEDKKDMIGASSINVGVKKITNIFSNIAASSVSDSDSQSDHKQVTQRTKKTKNDGVTTAQIIKKSKKKAPILNESSSKENVNDTDNDDSMEQINRNVARKISNTPVTMKKLVATNTKGHKSPLTVAKKEIIPGQKQIDILRKANKDKADRAKAELRRPINPAAATVPANTIVPGLKNLQRFNKGERHSPRLSAAKKTTPVANNTVSCQTSPSMADPHR